MSQFKYGWILLLVMLAVAVHASDAALSWLDKLAYYAGDNAAELEQVLNASDPQLRNYAEFLLEAAAPEDFVALSADYLEENIRYALLARDFSYATYSETVFRHFVLPHRASQEPLEAWRKPFYETLKPLVEKSTTIEEAAIRVNLWVTEQMTFKPTHGRDQAPLTTIKRGYGRCEESMILYIAAARSVGIPARPASVPYWNFMDNNHAWVEIWTPSGWRYLGEAENATNRTWFSHTTQRATLISSPVYGHYDDADVYRRKNQVSYISSIKNYTASQDCEILVEYADQTPAPNAKITLYAASFGGLFPMTNLQTDSQGQAYIPLGEGTVWVTASRDSLWAFGTLNTMQTQSLRLTLQSDFKLATAVQFAFPLAHEQYHPNREEVLGEAFYPLREIAELKRKNRLLNQQNPWPFLRSYDAAFVPSTDSTAIFKREKMLQKCNELAGNVDIFAQVLVAKQEHPNEQRMLWAMLEQWDSKDLIELPDSATIAFLAQMYRQSNERFDLPDSLFFESVIGPTWNSANPPQNGWQPEFYAQFSSLIQKDLTATAQAVLATANDHFVVEEEFPHSYFSGSLNPLQIWKMQRVSSFQRIQFLNSALKCLGVPVRWKGHLQYFNGTEFASLETPEQEENVEGSITIELEIDGVAVEAKPFENFLIAAFDDGEMHYIYFDGTPQEQAFQAQYYAPKGSPLYVQAITRNENGDAQVALHSFTPEDSLLQFGLQTPRTAIDATAKWPQATVDKLRDQLIADSEQWQLLIVRGPQQEEPEIRLWESLRKQETALREKGLPITVYSVDRPKMEPSQLDFVTYRKGNSLWNQAVEYPVLFLFSPQQELVFASEGMHFGVLDFIMKKVKTP